MDFRVTFGCAAPAYLPSDPKAASFEKSPGKQKDRLPCSATLLPAPSDSADTLVPIVAAHRDAVWGPLAATMGESQPRPLGF